MRRLRNDRGATAVVTALLLTSLVGFAAVSVDVGSLWWDQKEIQNGADAAALAIAQQYADGNPPADNIAEANQYIQGNKSDTNAAAVSVEFPTSTSVRVEATTTRTHWLAPVVGIASSVLNATAVASWDEVPSSAATIPLTVSHCAFDDVLDDPSNLFTVITKTSPTGPTASPSPSASASPAVPGPVCPPAPSPHVVEGGFQWLSPDSGCEVELAAGDFAPTSPGNTNPSGCDSSALTAALQSDEVLLPLFDDVTGTGNNAQYHITGFAAIRVTAYCLASGSPKIQWNTTKCTGSERWITGYFVRFVSLEDAGGTGGEDFGVSVVRLSE
ncbi:pilus assembly protein TadG-related protein [Tessaracoccus sp. OS52]|uniref:pilus assembly protein TadG-related protein n=1 Tax=Tessaracoccus sp. OS52 TaxID=2886691 RepID=UPI001D1010CF|nr:pilus assembly protein TadG-related protein [Tessaracoccus sp. OS52]MCC2594132.1 pilus assembly protein TadG-related protein [Tessaracoccus sp. OS52]